MAKRKLKKIAKKVPPMAQAAKVAKGVRRPAPARLPLEPPQGTIGRKLLAAMNQQIGEELSSAYLYLAMAASLDEFGFAGMAHWMKAQAIEETFHAMRFFDHIRSRDGQIDLPAIPKPQPAWDSPQAAYRAAYKHEQYITGRIHRLIELAMTEKDFAAQPMLQWFVTEQIEEEDSTLKAVDLLQRVGDSGPALIMADREFGARPMPITLPATEA
jgi:ferritin